MTLRFAARFLPVALALSAASAWAQEAPPADAPADGTDEASEGPGTAPIPDVGVQVAGGNGFALTPDGRSRLHLGVDAGGGIDTNPYSVPFTEAAFAGDLVLRVRPRASVDYPGSALAFHGVGNVDYGMLPGVLDARTRSLLLFQSLLMGDLEVNRGGALKFAVGDTFSWNQDPGNASLGLLFNRIHNQLRAGAGFVPGGGALSFKLGYTFDFVKYFDPSALVGGPVTSATINDGLLDNMLHSLTLRTDYRFLPRTGLFNTLSVGWSSYPLAAPGQAANTPQSFPITALIGVQGQILAKVAGLASVGYTNPLTFDEGALVTAGLIGVAGQAEVQWVPSPVTRMGAGYQRTFSPAPLYQYVGHNRFYGSLSQLLAGRFAIGINAGYSILEFGEEQIALTDTNVGRLDGHLDVLASFSYFFTDWMSLGVTDKLDWRVTNADDLVDPDLNFGYIRNQTFVLVSLAY